MPIDVIEVLSLSCIAYGKINGTIYFFNYSHPKFLLSRLLEMLQPLAVCVLVWAL